MRNDIYIGGFTILQKRSHAFHSKYKQAFKKWKCFFHHEILISNALEISIAPYNGERNKKLLTTVWFQTVEGNINLCILSGRQLGNISKSLKILFELDFRCLGIYSTDAIMMVFKGLYIKCVHWSIAYDRKKINLSKFLTVSSKTFNNYSKICIECLLWAKHIGFIKLKMYP